MVTVTEPHIRGEKSPVPINPDKYLNDDQLIAVQVLKQLGWSIYFVRRPRFQVPTIVMIDDNNQQIGLLMEDGDLDTSTHIPLRAEAISSPESMVSVQ